MSTTIGPSASSLQRLAGALCTGALLIVGLSLQAGCQFTDGARNGSHAPSEAAGPVPASPSAHQPDRGELPAITPRDGRSKPVVAVVGSNSGTEVTDYVVPYAVLSESGVADIWALGTRPGPISMFPALTIEPPSTTAEFDAHVPHGADVVIVPAVHDDEDPELLAWITAQAEQGAVIVGICDGVWVLARAGLLSGRQAAGHWYSMKRLQKRFPETTWVRDQRYVADGRIVTTTGVTASTPVSLALVGAMAGRERADSLAHALGVHSWSSHHDSEPFTLRFGHVRTAVANRLAVWGRETVGIPVHEGIDDVALALTADAYARTYRSGVESVAAVDGFITTRNGLRLLPDAVSPERISWASDGPVSGAPNADGHRHVPVPDGDPVDYLVPLRTDRPARALDDALSGIAERYGERTAAFVALQLEYAP